MRLAAVMKVATAGAGLAALVCGAAWAAPSPPSAGRYTVEQATRGAQVYAQSCAMCHKDDLSGDFDNPPLVGRFARNWAGADLAGMADYLHRAMPEFAPATLSPQDNIAVLAFILQANGEQAGPTPLPQDPAALAGMRFRPRAM